MATPVQDQYRNPNAKIDEWLDGTETGGAPLGYQGDKKKVYARRTIMPDGTTTTVYFERGTFDPATGSDKVIGQESSTNADIAKDAAATEKEANAQVDVRDEKDPQTGAPIRVTRRRSDNTIIKTEPAPASAASSTGTAAQRTDARIEGTPDPAKEGGFDNERPVMVFRDEQGNKIGSRELTAAERKEWEESRQRTRNPGGRSDAEIETATAKPPTERVNPEDPTRRQRWDPTAEGGKGAWVDAGAIAKPTDPSKPPTERANPEDPTRRQRWDPSANGGQGGWVDAGAIAKPLGQHGSPKSSTTEKRDGKTIRTTIFEDDFRQEEVLTEDQGADPTYIGSMPSYIPPEIATDLTNYSQELNAAVLAGTITPSRATALMNARLQAAQAAADNELTAAQNIYSAGVTQRGQDITQSNAALNESGANFRQALTTAGSLNGWVNRGSDAGYRLFNALRQQGLEDAQKYGGLDKQPVVEAPPAIQRAANITVRAPDGTVVEIPQGAATSTPAPVTSDAVPGPPMPPVQSDPGAPVPGVAPDEQQARMLNMAPTGVASIDRQGQMMAAARARPPMTFESIEQKFRELGMNESAIQQSRLNIRGAA